MSPDLSAKERKSMAVQQLTDDLWVIPGMVHVYLLDTEDGLAVLDTGFPGRAPKILDAVRQIGRTPTDVHHILLSHCHPDHIGSAGALQHETGATVWAHPLDAPRIEAGLTMRDGMHASPGLRNGILAKLLRRRVTAVEPVKVNRLLDDGDSPSFAPDLTAIHVPGHSQGQLAFLWRRHGGVLFPADTCVNRRGLTLPVGTEDPELAVVSLAKLADFDFEMVCVMHGPPITSGGTDAIRQININLAKNGRA
jgi:glyoxylase-like metal-dependent hydrolase (beta-lactamase superfamily II)